jgi:hypothetical protein
MSIDWKTRYTEQKSRADMAESQNAKLNQRIDVMQRHINRGADHQDNYRKHIDKLEAQLQALDWISVKPTKHPSESGKYDLMFDDGKMGLFTVIVETTDDWEDDNGDPMEVESAKCHVPWIGSIMIGEDLCCTHYRKATPPSK